MRIFSLIFRYASRSFLSSFVVSLLCLFSIIVLFDFAEIQRRTSSKEVTFLMKLNMVVLRAPHFLEQILPFLIFIAALFVFWRMNRTNELIIFRSTGISLWRLIFPISVTGLLIGFIDLTAFNPLAVAMQARYEKLVRNSFASEADDIKVSANGLWLSEQRGPNQVVYRADKINLKELEFEGMTLLTTSPKNQFLQRIDAKVGKIKGNRLLLEDGWLVERGRPPEHFNEKEIETSLTQSKIRKLQVNREIYSFRELPSYIKLLQSAGLNSLKYQMSWHSMIASAFWAGAMVLLAAAFACRPYRQGKTLLLILLGIVIGFSLYFFKDMTFALGAAGSLPPYISAWLPPLVTIMVGAVAVFSEEDG